MACRELIKLRESIQALIDQRFVEEALGADRLPVLTQMHPV